jgi:hypothetical protein
MSRRLPHPTRPQYIPAANFALYLRKRRSYTEEGFELRGALAALPETIDSFNGVAAWMIQQKVPRRLWENARRAWKEYRDLVAAHSPYKAGCPP